VARVGQHVHARIEAEQHAGVEIAGAAPLRSDGFRRSSREVDLLGAPSAYTRSSRDTPEVVRAG
jgi:hypothetical protein